MSYLVIDTEGNPDLKEIALIDSSGQVIYHAHSQEYAPDHPQPKPLVQIVTDLQHLAQDKLLIFHYADHDLDILKRAFQKARQPWLSNPTFCTWLAAKQYFPNLASYSLEHLSQHLGIQLASGYFNPNIAHDASYDALFTYHLYRHLIHAQLKAQNLPNPFANSKVDNPFQHYPDDTTTYHPQYQQLTAALQDIQQDANHQSRGVILLGEPGSGKTHLIMRVAQNLLRHNRLLFIPQPTHPDNIYHHIYSHTLESLREYVDDRHHTQLDYLIAKSFVEILKTLPQTQKNQNLLAALTADPLNLFHRLGAEGTERRRQQWQLIEKQVLRWWAERNFLTGATESLLKGIIKYCSYTDPNRRQQIIRWLSGNDLDPEDTALIGLPAWSEDLDRNTFALEGMKVIGRLALLDQPLIIVFDQLEALGRSENRDILLNLGDALKELLTLIPNSLFILNLFPDRWQHFQTQWDRATLDRLSQTVITLNPPPLPQLQKLKTGELDCVVGTHQLLSNTVTFRDLGLLVVDEEQRFGVNHKEKIKALKTTVDVLTLTATPIPRTLSMALSGLREMSLITTPPPSRRPIKTHLIPYQPETIRAAIAQELDRGGQVFYVLPKIAGMEAAIAQIQQMIPTAKIMLAHGQLAPEELEVAMLAFSNGEADILVCTTIVESGLDIPRVNTIIIEDANRFGLAQLYQLRGRVGRAGIQAHAWLTYPGEELLTEEAKARLRAIQEFTHLGSGYQLALRDLDIRGAGDILGAEQSGQVAAVGFDLYLEMLQEAIQEVRGQEIPSVDDTQIDLNLTAFIPANYMPNLEQKLSAYRTLATAETPQELTKIAQEWVNSYGELPVPVVQLILVMRVKLLAKQLGISRIRPDKPHVILETTMAAPAWQQLLTGLSPKLHSRFVHTPGKITVRGLATLPPAQQLEQLLNWFQAMVQRRSE